MYAYTENGDAYAQSAVFYAHICVFEMHMRPFEIPYIRVNTTTNIYVYVYRKHSTRKWKLK